MNLPHTSEAAGERPPLSIFTPSNSNPEDLEFILVQRHDLLKDAVERVRESALTANKHHLLFVGPRGAGKTHLVTLLVHRLGQVDTLSNHLRIAWLNEDETSTTLLEFLIKVYTALEKRHPEEFRASQWEAAFDMKPAEALTFVSKQLLQALGEHTLLIVTENIDAIFEGLGDRGQKQLRSFIQENPKLSIVATGQRLVEGLSKRTSPFFGFFQTEHLKPLNVKEATELLQNVAKLYDKTDVAAFLATPRGYARMRALHHLSGGNHRIYLVLSQFITRDTVDTLVGPFIKMVDELTPYYQERVRWLPPQQRKIVELLCSAEGTLAVKDIARRLFSTNQVISSQLLDLKEKGYVESNQRGRESLYDVSEPLMRICVEVKENQHQRPLKLLVDFLRVWYDDADLKVRLERVEPKSHSYAYMQSALERNLAEGDLRHQILREGLTPELTAYWSEVWGVAEFEALPEGLLLTAYSIDEGDFERSILCLGELLEKEMDPARRALLFIERGIAHGLAGRVQQELDDYTAVINLPDAPVEQVTKALNNRGVTHGQAGRVREAIDDYTAAINLPDAPVEPVARALYNRGVTHGEAGRMQEAIDDYTAAINLPDAPVEQVARALNNRGFTHGQSGRMQQEMDDYTAVINLPDAPLEQVARALYNRGVTHAESGRMHESMEDYTAVVNLPDAPVDQVAKALNNRGATHDQAGRTQEAIDDYTAVINLPDAPAEDVAWAFYNRGLCYYYKVSDQRDSAKADFRMMETPAVAPEWNRAVASILLATLSFHEGRWQDGLGFLETGLALIAKNSANGRAGVHQALANSLFLTSLSREARQEKVAAVLRLYQAHKLLPHLGDALVQHLGDIENAGGSPPSPDNLESWAVAWEKAAAHVDDFRLTLRLLRMGVEYLKTGGKDRGVLLTLTKAERRILEQAFGLEEEEQA